MIELHELTADDWKTWRGLRLAALADAPSAFGSRLADWENAGEDRWRARLELPRSYNLIAVLDGTPVGMASGVLPPDEEGVAHLISMWISPTARGQGIGDKLMTDIETWARAASAHTLKLSVVEGNEKAHSLYVRNGYVDTDEPGDLMPDGITREIVMAKQLTS
ncbi:ribosomal protein S18 acetylase RimI-like enzyme [Kribbella voronezhensis]|uniref:Ribosomal protein S18 acetylase RimI-like enzyme n=1 Tax=Kribbella voronezhensis TaxID=2512212 RepID=A0A4R7TGQ5_9ACTN|nr:GNAT family N-acetyltransferase [Kribbella voronezhensis]TDU90688.1 ribosomal protein S18 acetylase RimI-like enzyme [Kribbella voronezhensis]